MNCVTKSRAVPPNRLAHWDCGTEPTRLHSIPRFGGRSRGGQRGGRLGACHSFNPLRRRFNGFTTTWAREWLFGVNARFSNQRNNLACNWIRSRCMCCSRLGCRSTVGRLGGADGQGDRAVDPGVACRSLNRLVASLVGCRCNRSKAPRRRPGRHNGSSPLPVRR